MGWFKPGHIPHGWERGEKLLVQPATTHTAEQMGRIGWIRRAQTFTLFTEWEKHQWDVEAITFWDSDEAEVAEWIKWWNSTE